MKTELLKEAAVMLMALAFGVEKELLDTPWPKPEEWSEEQLADFGSEFAIFRMNHKVIISPHTSGDSAPSIREVSFFLGMILAEHHKNLFLLPISEPKTNYV